LKAKGFLQKKRGVFIIFGSMTRTFYIDESRKGAKELLAYLRSLEFVVEESEPSLTDDQFELLEHRRSGYLDGTSKTYTIEVVESNIRSRKK
jgi:hypothetical protein